MLSWSGFLTLSRSRRRSVISGLDKTVIRADAISVLEIHAYCQIYEISGPLARDFLEIVSVLDAAYLEVINKEA